MQITLEIERPNRLSETIAARCRTLTLPHGLMRATFNKCQTSEFLQDSSYVILARNKLGTIVGWALVFPRGRVSERPRYSTYFYVTPRYRQKGIGTMLAEKALEITGEAPVRVHPGGTNADFFRSPIFQNPRFYTGSLAL